MNEHEMVALVDRHLEAEGAGDVAAATSVYTEDIVHDSVGFPGTPRVGKQAAREFYEYLTANFRAESEEVIHRWVHGDTMFMEQWMTGSVIGEMLGLPGNGRRITFRMFHVFEFSEGLISREQIWLDTGAIAAQLTAP